MAGIAVSRKELTTTELGSAAGKTRDARAARRMLAIALVLDELSSRHGFEWRWRTTASRRPGPAAWTARRCGEAGQETFRGTVCPPNGCIAPMPRVWRG